MPTIIASNEHEKEPGAQKSPEFGREQLETERKFLLTNPDVLASIIDNTEPSHIHQLYLSYPDEPYSLRLRETISPSGEVIYEACMKDRGSITDHGLRRLESTIPISEATFQAFCNTAPGQLFKQRYEPIPGVTIDLIEGATDPIIEIEDMSKSQDAQDFFSSFYDVLQEVTGEPAGSGEEIAFRGRTSEHEQQLNTEKLFSELLTRLDFHPAGSPLVVTLSGRSGSGKTTVTRQLRELFSASRPGLRVATLSTDDYHRGKQALETMLGGPCTNWDAPLVYNTKLMAFDIWQLSQGDSVQNRAFNFRTQEVDEVGTIEPADVIIVEGIVASSPDLDPVRTLHFDLGTPLATCLGRDMDRIRKDTRGNGGIGSHLDRLAYILEVAEPTYQQTNRTIRNPFSASVRPMAGIALRAI